MPEAGRFTIMIEDTLSSSKTLRAEHIIGGTGERGFYDWDKMKDEVLLSNLLNSNGLLPLNASFDLDLSGDNLDGVPYDLTDAQMPAVRKLAGWFMSKPIANAENVRII